MTITSRIKGFFTNPVKNISRIDQIGLYQKITHDNHLSLTIFSILSVIPIVAMVINMTTSPAPDSIQITEDISTAMADLFVRVAFLILNLLFVFTTLIAVRRKKERTLFFIIMVFILLVTVLAGMMGGLAFSIHGTMNTFYMLILIIAMITVLPFRWRFACFSTAFIALISSIYITQPDDGPSFGVILNSLVILSCAYVFSAIAFHGYVNQHKGNLTIRKQKEEMEKMSITDSLTGLYNRRMFDQVYPREWKISCRDSRPISILMLDVDHFKNYNDLYGHIKGDETLIRVAEKIQATVHRAGDICTRFGGEEFLLLLLNTDEKGALHVAQKICQSIESEKIDHADSSISKVLTVSCGCATTYPTGGMDPEELIVRADKALYRAKDTGRNRAVSFDPEML